MVSVYLGLIVDSFLSTVPGLNLSCVRFHPKLRPFQLLEFIYIYIYILVECEEMEFEDLDESQQMPNECMLRLSNKL